MTVLSEITYRLRSPTDDRWTAVTVSSDGDVHARTPNGEEREFRLRSGVGEDLLEALSAALDDSGFPQPPQAPLPDSELAEIDVSSGGRTSTAIVGLPVHARHGGWAELVRLLSALLDQATLGAGKGTESLPPVLDPA